MSESVPIIGLLSSLLLPWAFGATWAHCLLRKSGHWNGFVVAGHGYLLGVFLTTLLIRLWHFAGLPLHYWSIAAVVLALTLAGLALIRLQAIPARVVPASSKLEKWELAVIALLLGLILFRYGTIFQELLLRPLFPWDAWMNWAPKAVVWHYHNDLTPWVSITEWLKSSGDTTVYTAGAGKAWKYPETIPVLQFWGMMALGTSDHTLIYLPWLLVAVALGLALYGHLRLTGASIVISVMGCYFLLNLPFISTHVALAGYADIWVAAVFGCAIFALHEWGENRQWQYALLSTLLALVCTQLKIPGLIMGAIIIVVLLASIIRPSTKVGVSFALIGAACFIYIVIFGVDISIAHIGRIKVTAHDIELPYIGRYQLQYHSIHHAVVNALFLMINWNVLWYLFILAIMTSIFRKVTPEAPPLVLSAIVLALLFIFFVYYFTNRYEFALDFTQINRALIYSIPAIVFYIFHSGFRKQQPTPETGIEQGVSGRSQNSQ
jgi:hypothetical protein